MVSILACPFPGKKPQPLEATGTKSKHFNEKEECSR